jgi:hypothetical protein
LEPEDDDPLWTAIRKMADEIPKALARLLDAIHEFEKGPMKPGSVRPGLGLKIDPKDSDDVHEVYLVPALYHDSSALMGVKHDARTLHFVGIYERLRPEEDARAQWDEITERAAKWRSAMKLP